MATGTVKWFNDAKGYGFITQDGGGEDVFCHHTAIQTSGFRRLVEGQAVEFEVKRGPKGLLAENVRPLSLDADLLTLPGPSPSESGLWFFVGDHACSHARRLGATIRR